MTKDAKMDAVNRLKIAFITAFNTQDKKSLSGAAYHLSSLMAKYCGEVVCIDKLRPDKIGLSYFLKNPASEFSRLCFRECLKTIFWKMLGKRHQWDRTLAISKYYSKKITEKLGRGRYDIIFAEKASIELALLDIDTPVIYESDATFRALVNYYPDYSNLAEISLMMGDMIEGLALKKAALCIFTSNWAADSAMRDYGIQKDKIMVIPPPAYFENIPPKEIVMQKKDNGICKLLFVGVDWKRKGGDIAVDAVNCLNKKGVRSKLTICGCIPPKKYHGNRYLEITGFLDKNSARDKDRLESLFLGAHFLILPTRAEAFAHVLSEAGAYALPVITTDTGGIPSFVINLENGIVMRPEAPGEDFAREIINLWRKPALYESIRQKSRAIFEQKLSDEAWAASVNKAIALIRPASIAR